MAGLALGLVILGLGHMRLVRVAHTHEAPPARRQASATAEMASDRVAARAEANRLAAEEAAAAAAMVPGHGRWYPRSYRSTYAP